MVIIADIIHVVLAVAKIYNERKVNPMKKILALVLTLILALGTCAAVAEGLKIGVSIVDLGLPSFTSLTVWMRSFRWRIPSLCCGTDA